MHLPKNADGAFDNDDLEFYSSLFDVMEMAPAFRLSSLHAKLKPKKKHADKRSSHILGRLMQTFLVEISASIMIFQKVSCQRGRLNGLRLFN